MIGFYNCVCVCVCLFKLLFVWIVNIFICNFISIFIFNCIFPSALRLTIGPIEKELEEEEEEEKLHMFAGNLIFILLKIYAIFFFRCKIYPIVIPHQQQLVIIMKNYYLKTITHAIKK